MRNSRRECPKAKNQIHKTRFLLVSSNKLKDRARRKLLLRKRKIYVKIQTCNGNIALIINTSRHMSEIFVILSNKI